MPDVQQHSPAAERNREPILLALRQLLPETGFALEIASGTGQHMAWFAHGLPGWSWQPSDRVPDAFDSIRAWCQQAAVTNVRPPLQLDVCQPAWPADGMAFAQPFDAIFCANMLHISPWATCGGLMRGAARHLSPGGQLITYGPYLERGVPTSPGNQNFDQSLRQRNQHWGLRWLNEVAEEAAAAGLMLRQRQPMPANNLLLTWVRDPG